MKLNVALLQLSPCYDTDKNLEKGLAACREAKAKGADLALFPEMWSNSYNMTKVHDREFIDRSIADDSIPADGPFVTAFAQLARELEMAIGITFLEKHDPMPKNSLIVFDRHGKEVIHYSKVHTCDFGHEYALTPGDDFYTGKLDTAQGEVTIGAIICYDREFPESARINMLKGAEIILTPNSCELEINRLTQYRTRSYENVCAMVMTNYPEDKDNGHSVVFDGVGFDQSGRPRNMCVLEAGEDEGIFIAEIDLDALRRERAGGIWGDAFRRPSRYGRLTAMEECSPFERKNNRR